MSISPVTIIIPIYNGKELIKDHFPSVFKAADRAGVQIVVADDASTDDSVDFLRNNYPSVKVLTSETNMGFGMNCNRAIEAVYTEFIVLLNSDVEVEHDFLPPLLNLFRESPDLFAVSPRILNAARDGKDEAVNYFEFKHGLIRPRFPCLEGGPTPSSATPVGYACGACAMIDRAKFMELGGFSSFLAPNYWEDTDLGYRAWKRGWRILYEPKSTVRHQHQQTISKIFTRDAIHIMYTERHFLFTWHNLTDTRPLLNHMLWLFRFPLSYALHWDLPGLIGFFRAFGSIKGVFSSRKRNLSLRSDKETLQVSKPDIYRSKLAD